MDNNKNKKKILIIDDEADFAKLVKWNLESTEGYEVKIESKGAQGLAAAKQFQPDLILLDIMMPDMEGSAVAHQIVTNKETSGIPIVFLTAIIEREEMGGKTVIGGHPFLIKPVGTDELIGCIKKYIR